MKSVKKNDTKEPSVRKTSDDTTYKTQVTEVYNLISRVFPPGKIPPSRLPATKFLFPSQKIGYPPPPFLPPKENKKKTSFLAVVIVPVPF